MSEKTSLMLTGLSAVSENVDVGFKKNKAEPIYKKPGQNLLTYCVLNVRGTFFSVKSKTVLKVIQLPLECPKNLEKPNWSLSTC
jgi:hypothetical protein